MKKGLRLGSTIIGKVRLIKREELRPNEEGIATRRIMSSSIFN